MNWNSTLLLSKIEDKVVGISSYRLYKEYIFTESRRPKERDVISGYALYILLDNDLDCRVRSSSYVVLCYKCIEEDQRTILREVYDWFDKLESEVFRNIDLSSQFLGIREDYRQIYISLLTVRWHVEIILGVSPLNTLKKIEEFSVSISVRGNSITLTQNIGRGLLLYAFYFFAKNDFISSKIIIDKLWNYFCSSIRLMLSSNIPGSSHFGDFLKLVSYVQQSAAGAEWITGERLRKEFWSKGKIMNAVPRVKLEPSHYFNLNLSRFLDSQDKLTDSI